MVRESNLAGLVGAKVVDRDGDKIGTIGRIYVDPSTGRANWAAVRTGLFGTSETFLPLLEAVEEGDDIRVPYAKAFVKDAPRVDDDKELSHEEEDALNAYYDSLLPGRDSPAEPVGDGAERPPRHVLADDDVAGDSAPEGPDGERSDPAPDAPPAQP